MAYEIKKGIPVPVKDRYSNFPFSVMEVGDCFDVPAKDFTETSVKQYV